MKARTTFFVLLAMGCAAVLPAAAQSEKTPETGCETPARPQAPALEGLEKDDVLQYRQAVQRYVAASRSYITCLNKAMLGVDHYPADNTGLVRAHNQAVDEMAGAIGEFNALLESWRAR